MELQNVVFIEIDSWVAAMEWSGNYRHVAFVFIWCPCIIKPSSFENRELIANKSVEKFNNEAAAYGFKAIRRMGVELDRDDTYNELEKRTDRTSIMLRHRPDAIGFTESESVLLQIKGTCNGEDDIKFIWADELEFKTVYVPTKHRYFDINMQRLKSQFADKEIVSVEWRGGSGTPCIMYPRKKLNDILDLFNREKELLEVY